MTEPVSLADARLQLGLFEADGHDDDPLIQSLIVAARRAVELRTNRVFTGNPATLTGDDALVGKQAILLLVGGWYSNREAAAADAKFTPAEMPLTVTWLLDPLRQWDDGS